MKFLLFPAIFMLLRTRGVAALVPIGLSLLLLGSQASAQNNALHFNGTGSPTWDSDDHVSVPYNSSFDLTQATFETWVKWDGAASIGNLFMRLGSVSGYGWGVGIRSDGIIEWWQQYSQDAGPNSTGSVTPGTWTHIAVTVVNGGDVTFYINGVNAGSSSGALLINGGTGTLIIGKQGPHDNYFRGAMDEFRIWNVVRTQTQIQNSMNTELAGNEAGLICYYKFNQGTANGTNTSVTTLTDVVDCNTGTLTNFDLSGTTSNWVAGPTLTAVAPPAGTPEINVRGNSINIVDGDATPSGADHTNFGCSNVAVTRTFTIQNLCAATLNISSITNSNPTDYTLGTVPTTIAGGGSATFTVEMKATTEGTKTATITINSNDANEAAYDFAITGKISTATALYTDAGIATSGDGQSWATAYKTLSEALAAAQVCSGVNAVYVAAGTYKPTQKPFNAGVEMTTADARDVTFQLRSGLALYGGYPAGGGTRNVATNVTILSGDIAGNDDASNADGNFINENASEIVGTDNAYHVVLAAFANSTPTTRIDGFTITGGNANTNSSINVPQTINRNRGAAIYTNYGTNTFANNRIVGNATNSYGAGIAIEEGSNTITGNTFFGNTASGQGGGGAFLWGGTNTVSNNTFSGNSGNNGGAISTFTGSHTIINNTLAGNTGTNQGGGIYFVSSTNILRNNIFWGNKKGTNTAVQSADFYGGSATNTFKNNLLQLSAGNYTTTGSGNYDLGTTASGNLFATDPLFVDADGADNISGNADDNVQLLAGSPAVNTGTATGAPATDILGTARPQGGSMDMGAYEQPYACPSAVVYVDGGIATSGDGQSWATAYKTLDEALTAAHYCPAVTTVNVATGTYKPTKKPFNGGVEMTTAYAREVTFHLRDGLALYGGYPAGGGVRNITANPTILSGDLNGNDVGFTNNAENAFHVVLASAASSGGVGVTIDGFSVTSGYANASGGVSPSITVNGNVISHYYGSGVSMTNGTNTISNLTCYNNDGSYGGAGLYANAGTNTFSGITLYSNRANTGAGLYTLLGTNTLTNSVLYSNNANTEGGGIYMEEGTNNTLTNNQVYSNYAASNGAGIRLFKGTNTLSGNLILQNSAGQDGGGISINSGSNTLVNNVFSLNSANYGGAVYSVYATSNVFTNNTFYANATLVEGGALRMYDDDVLTLTNNIFRGNTISSNAAVAGADIYCNAVVPTVNNCLTQLNSSFPGTNGVNNQDPLFVDAADIDGADNVFGTADDGLRLQATSPARNMGLNSAVAALPRDLAGNTRIFGGTVDMGAYEQFDLAAFTAVAGTSQAVAADGQYTDPNGWTHYVNDATDKYILSIKKNGNDIGTIGDGTFTVTANTTAAWGPTAAATITAPYATNTGWKVMNRWWKVTPTTQPATNVQVRTYYTQADLDGLKAVTGDNALTHTQLKFYKINGAGTNPDPALGHSGIAVAANYSANGYWEYNNSATSSTTTWAAGTAGSDFYAEYTVASFSGGGGGGSQGGGNSNPLFPVEWLSFSATPAGETVVLDWITASEQNNASFTAERSLNGVDFEAIGTIAAIGSSSSPTTYTYPDNDLPAGASQLHYRIRQTDTDGKASHSETRTVTLDRASGLMAWPNPATHRLAVRVPEGVYAVVLADEAGRVVRTTSTDGQAATLSVDLSGLAAGVYVLRAGTATIRVVRE